jgi:hypothetical protein
MTISQVDPTQQRIEIEFTPIPVTAVEFMDEVSTFKIGGNTYRAKRSLKCNVCQSEYYHSINRALVSPGWFPQAILDAMPEGHGITTECLKSHIKGEHVPLQIAQQKAIIDHRREEMERNFGTAYFAESLGLSIADEVMRQAWQQLADENYDITLTDAMNAAKFVAQQRTESVEAMDETAIMAAFIAFDEAARKYMTAAQYQAFLEEISTRQIIAKSLALEAEGEEVERKVGDEAPVE